MSIGKLLKSWQQGREQVNTCLSLACHTEQEIADAVGIAKMTVSEKLQTLCTEKFLGTKLYKLSLFQEDEWTPPLYDV